MVSKTMFETHADNNAMVDQTGPVTQGVTGNTTFTGPSSDDAGTIHPGEQATVTFNVDDDNTYSVYVQDGAGNQVGAAQMTSGIGAHTLIFDIPADEAVGTTLQAEIGSGLNPSFGTLPLTVTAAPPHADPTVSLAGDGHAADPANTPAANATSNAPFTATFTADPNASSVTIQLYDNGNRIGDEHTLTAAELQAGTYTFAPVDVSHSGDPIVALVKETFSDTTDTPNAASNAITFTDAAPTVSGPVAYTTAENTGSADFKFSLLANASDSDDAITSLTASSVTVSAVITHADHSTTNVTAVSPSDYTVDSDGTFHFSPSKLTLAQGDTEKVTVSYDVEDPNGAASGPTSATFTVTANAAATHNVFAVFTDDQQAITASSSTGPAGAPVPTTLSGGFATDLLAGTSDSDDTLSINAGSLKFTVLDSSGNVVANAPTYSVAPGSTNAYLTGSTLHIDTALLDALNVGQTDQIRVDYTVHGDNGGNTANDFADSRIIAVSGTNDAPTATAGTATISETDLPYTTSLLANVKDVDSTNLSVVMTGANAPTVTATDSSGQAVTLTANTDYSFDSSGNFKLISDPATGSYTDKLHYGDFDKIVVSYTVTDNNATTPKTVSTTETITLNGSAEQVYGNGTFSGTANADVIHGSYGPPAATGAGYVTINPTTIPTQDTGTAATHDSINGGDGNDTIYGGDGDSTLAGNAGNDVIYGGSGTNMIYGGQGDDMLIGGSGNDSIEGGIGNDTIIGGGGINTATYTADTAGINADLRNEGTMSPSRTMVATAEIPAPIATVTGGSGTDYLTNIQNLSGGLGNDTIHGSDTFSSVFNGNNGDDVITAGNLASVDTGAGDQSQLYGNVGNDTLIGGLGNDLINGGQGDDVVYASTGYDVLVGGKDSTLNTDGSHADYNALDSNNKLTNVHGDTLTFNQVSVLDQSNTGAANDPGHTYFDGMNSTYYNGVIVDLSLTTQQATYTDSQGHVAVDTISGFENLAGSIYNDALNGDANANVILGLDGDDRLQGNAGNDTILGGNGNDIIFGNTGDDVLFGNAGNDTINGGQGNDVIHGGTGANTLTGGLGADTFVLSYSTNAANQTNSIVTTTNGTTTVSDTITDFSGTGGQGDKIDLSEVSASAHETLHFVGNFFTGAMGDVIVTQGNGAGHYLLEIDLNGDGQADFIANVNGAATTNGGHAAAPVAGDFTGLTYTAPATPVNALVHIDHHADLFG